MAAGEVICRRIGAALAVGLIALTAAPSALAGDVESPDPQLVPAPGPVVPLPGPAAASRDLGASISSLPKHRVPAPSRKGGTWTARIVARTVVRNRPRGKGIWVARGWSEWSGGTQKLMVLGSWTGHGQTWLKVRLPTRPNGRSGWLRRDLVVLDHSWNYLRLDISRRRLKVFGYRGHLKGVISVVIGKPSTPTPLGLFALYDRIRQADPHGFVGPWVLPLTAHSDQLREFDGGPGLVALHGRDGASLYDPLGSARSHGCIRMNNNRIRQILKIDLGTAIRIHR